MLEVRGYPGATRDEVAAIENISRERAYDAGRASLTLAFGRALPADVIARIAAFTHPHFRERVTHATRTDHAQYRTFSRPRGGSP